MPNPTCEHCGEPVRPDERSELNGAGQTFHHECAARLGLGSLAHVLRRCSCFVPGASETDPPHMTKRAAAQAAFAVARITFECFPADHPSWRHR